MVKKFSIILAVDSKNGIGKSGKLPWKISGDMKYFKEKTSKTSDLAKLNAVIMGRKTWESIPSKFRPFSDRINCILSRNIKNQSINSKIDDFVLYFNNLETCIEEISLKENLEKIFIIGGANLYNQVLENPLLEKIYLTIIEGDFGCDTFFDGFDEKKFEKIEESEKFEENGIKYHFEVYKRLLFI